MPLDPEVQKRLDEMTDKEIHDLGGRVWMGIGVFVVVMIVLVVVINTVCPGVTCG